MFVNICQTILVVAVLLIIIAFIMDATAEEERYADLAHLLAGLATVLILGSLAALTLREIWLS